MSSKIFWLSFELKRLRIPNCGMGVAQSLDEDELLSEGCGPFEEHTECSCLVFPMTIHARFVDPKDSAKENYAAKT